AYALEGLLVKATKPDGNNADFDVFLAAQRKAKISRRNEDSLEKTSASIASSFIGMPVNVDLGVLRKAVDKRLTAKQQLA
ncbi:unnamed protein product, partial [Prorocentrum cordatum]